MATYTSHLNLKLPDYSDTADIKDLNDNFKKIDDAIASGGTGGGTGGGIVTETDPTVPSWAKQPSKPTYTADEVGALPDTTVIPTVPSALPNPQPIIINGISYDGSERKEITVQAGDGGSIAETDPTVPAWAKAEKKPSYTAEEVGALPSTYEPPVMSVNGKTGAVSLVASDVGALPSTTVIPTVPNALKNPYPLTINGIAYDGSEAKTVTIESTGGGASVELDTTLTQYGKAADAGAVGNALAQETVAREAAVNSLKDANATQDTRLTALEQNAPSGISGLTVAQVNALNGMFKVTAFTTDPTDAYSAFKSAFGITDDEPDTPIEPEVTLTGISASYTGGDVAVGTSVNNLNGITVTATYSDGSTAVVTGYTVSGTIAEGANTITVTYDGMTSTFIVTGVAENVEPDEDTPVFVNHAGVSAVGIIGGIDFNRGTRMAYVSHAKYGGPYLITGSNLEYTDYAAIKIPDGAKQIKLDSPGYYGGLALYKVHEAGDKFTRIVDAGWSTLGGWTYDLTGHSDATHYTINFKNTDGSNIPDDVDTSGIIVSIL